MASIEWIMNVFKKVFMGVIGIRWSRSIYVGKMSFCLFYNVVTSMVNSSFVILVQGWKLSHIEKGKLANIKILCQDSSLGIIYSIMKSSNLLSFSYEGLLKIMTWNAMVDKKCSMNITIHRRILVVEATMTSKSSGPQYKIMDPIF